MSYLSSRPLEESKGMSVQFTTEELAFLFGLLGDQVFDSFRLPALPAKAVAPARDRLLARGLITAKNKKEFQINPALLRFFAPLLAPAQIMVLAQVEPAVYFFVKRDADFLFYDRSQPGIHTLTAILDEGTLARSLAFALGFNDVTTVPLGETFETDTDLLQQIQREKQTYKFEPLQAALINQYRMPYSLAHTLVHRQSYMVLYCYWQRGYEWGSHIEQVNMASFHFTIYHTLAGGAWVRKDDTKGGKRVIFKPMNGDTFVTNVIERLKQVPGYAKP